MPMASTMMASTIAPPMSQESRIDTSSLSFAFPANTEATIITMTHIATSCRIITLLESYRCSKGKMSLDNTYLTRRANILYNVQQGKPIHMVLPAFPFKSPNHVEKVLGCLPDKGEELALARLEGLCVGIDDVYPGGAQVCVVSDGLVYNDLLGVSDDEVWDYGEALRALSKERFPHITFARVEQLIPTLFDSQKAHTRDLYIANVQLYRETLVAENLPTDFNISHLLSNENDARMTYRGYIKFLAKDLAHSEIVSHESNKKFKIGTEKIAKKMILRGKAYANAIAQAFPNSIRLSIHPSDGVRKLSIALGKGDTCTTPWHSCMAFEMDGSVRFGHSERFESEERYEIAYGYNNSSPQFFRARSPLWDWGDLEVSLDPLYPCGLMIRPKCGTVCSIESVPMRKVRELAELNSPVILRGFTSTKSRPMFMQKAREMGTIMPWKFGDVLEVKDGGASTLAKDLNNVLSEEAMPMHFDGLFKTNKEVVNGVELTIPQPPRFQMFVAVTPSPPKTGYTLFASSRLLFSHLPPSLSLALLYSCSWSVRTMGFNSTTIESLALVTLHPTLQTACLRYHEHWPQDRTKFLPTHVSIQDSKGVAREDIKQAVERLLYDRRVCYWHTWEEGDVLVSDNVNMMHTRSTFSAAEGRELWRVHVD